METRRATFAVVERQYVLQYVCVAFGIQHAMRMRHIVIRGLSGCTIFSHIISQTARFSGGGKKRLLNTKCVF